MLSFKFVSNAAGAAHYFETADDYYGKEGHHGEWLGSGVALIGLESGDAVQREQFRRLLEGELPDGRRVRTSRTHAGSQRNGIDFTFSAPKSVSLQALMMEDMRVVQAHDAAVRESVQLLQTFAVARKKERGLSYRERTDTLVAAAFRHELSRAQDPQLHTHVVVMNLTQRGDGQWRALANEDLLRNVRLVGAFYRNTLATKLRQLGFELRATRKGGWELAHIPEAAIVLFSQRSREIERLLAASGRDRDHASAAQKQVLALASRPRKTQSDRVWLREHWQRSLREAGLDVPTSQKSTSGVDRPTHRMGIVLSRITAERRRAAVTSDNAVEFAIAHLAERQGIFSRSELLEVAYGRAATHACASDVCAALDRARRDGRLVQEIALYQTARSLSLTATELAKDPAANRFKANDEREKLARSSWIALTMATRGQTHSQATAAVDAAIARGALVATEQRFATPAACRSEQHLLAIERAGRGAVYPVAGTSRVLSLLKTSDLNEGQRAAVTMILTSRDRFVGVQGLAGTGKSHMLSKAVQEIKSQATRLSTLSGFKVIGLAPYTSQTRALATLGMASQTLASMLARRRDHDRLDDRTIVFLDEAGVVPAHQLERLMALIEQRRARLVLLGDRHQTHAVEAGKPFEQLQDAGMTKAFLTEIQRQRNPEICAAVIHAARGEVPLAVQRLEPSIVEVRVDAKRRSLIAEAYVRLSEPERTHTLIVAGTNEARREINALIRRNLSLEGGEQVCVLEPVDMTRAELRSTQSYDAGQVIIAQRSYGDDFPKGEHLQIVDVHHGEARNVLVVRGEDGRSIEFDPSTRSMLRVYQPQMVEMAPGDWVRASAHDAEQGLRNGERFRVTAVDATHLTLEGAGGKVSVQRSRGAHLQHAYASTVHSAQGLTCDRVLVDANTRSLSSNRAIFYVAVSRARDHVTLFTDDASRLATAMSREPKKYAALELREATGEAAILRARIDGKPIATNAQARLAATLRPKTLKVSERRDTRLSTRS